MSAKAAVAAALSLLPLTASDAVAQNASRPAIELSVGSFVPFDGDQNEVYGSAPWFGLGYSTGVAARGGTRLLVESGLISSSGSDTRPDPTFTTSDARYWVVPVILGITFDSYPRSEEMRARFTFGIALQWAATWWDGPFDDAHYAAAFGALFEAGPEFRIAKDWDLRLRGRVSIMTDASYDDGARKLNYSGGQIDIGVRRYLF